MSATTGLRPDNLEAIFPLSPVQESLLFAALKDGVDPGFLQLQCTLEGELDEAAFRDAWQRVVERHAALRSSIHWQEVEKRLQVVFRRVELPWRSEDWRDVAPPERAQRLAELLRADREAGLDLARAPVLRLALVRTADRAWHLVWSCHHVLLDGWSGAIVLGEVLALHEALCSGAEPALPPAPAYRDHVAWLKRQDHAAAEPFWRAALAGWYAPTPLPYDRGLRSVRTGEPGVAALTLDPDATRALAAFARARRVTLSTVVEGAWALLLSAHASADDICFGATVSGRATGVAGVESMVGLFINMLPVRVRVPGELSLPAFLQQLQEQHAALRRYEHTPPARIQEWSGVPGRQRLFDGLVVFENFPTPVRASPPGRVRLTELHGGITTGYPLTLVVAPAECLRCSLHFDPDRLAPPDAGRVLAQLRDVLARMVAAPDATVAELLPVPGSAAYVAPRADARDSLHADARDSVRAHPVPPRDATELQLARIWEDVLGVPVGVHDDFFDLGGHSLSAVQLFAGMERAFGRRLPLATLFEAPTIELLARRCRDEGWTPPWSSLVALQPLGHRPPLFCIHSYDGHVFPYHELARALAPDQPVYGLQAGGLDGREPVLSTVEDMASHYLREIRAVQPNGPYFLLGLCFGISVALELAHRMRAAGEAVGGLIILDSGFWTHVPRRSRARRTAPEQARHIVFEVSRRWRQTIGRRFATGARRHELHIGAVLERAWYAYRALAYTGRVTLIRSAEYAGSRSKDWHEQSWRQLTEGAVQSHVIPGRHTDLLRQPGVRELARHIRACTAGVPAPSGT